MITLHRLRSRAAHRLRCSMRVEGVKQRNSETLHVVKISTSTNRTTAPVLASMMVVHHSSAALFDTSRSLSVEFALRMSAKIFPASAVRSRLLAIFRVVNALMARIYIYQRGEDGVFLYLLALREEGSEHDGARRSQPFAAEVCFSHVDLHGDGSPVAKGDSR